MTVTPGRDYCVDHTAYLFDRGGRNRLQQLTPPVQVTWGRVRDDVSAASVVLAAPECEQSVATIEPGRHELVIYRGRDRMWEGPVTLVRWERGQVTVEAKDVMFYVQRLISRSGLDNAYPNIDTTVNRARALLETELPRMESPALEPGVNVLEHLETRHHDDDARTCKKTIPYQMTVFEDIDDLAAKSGIDYTVVGRSIVIHDTHLPLSRTATVTEADFDGDVIVTSYGNELATYAAVTGAEGVYGTAVSSDYVDPDTGVHPYYGLWEILDDAYDEEGDTSAPTQSELNSQAQRNLSGRMPTPVTVRIPDGSTLSPYSAVTLNDLVPGVQVPLVATLTGRDLSQMQKLDKLDVTETSAGEQVKITLSPESENALDPSELTALAGYQVRRGTA
jgi:hypothetical protein